MMNVACTVTAVTNRGIIYDVFCTALVTARHVINASGLRLSFMVTLVIHQIHDRPYSQYNDQSFVFVCLIHWLLYECHEILKLL